MISSMLSPSSRFSKIVATGRRVPRKTHAPLTFPGTLSTAAHFDQSSAIGAPPSFDSNGKSREPKHRCQHSELYVLSQLRLPSITSPNMVVLIFPHFFRIAPLPQILSLRQLEPHCVK